ncbi:hypothetical protein HJC23_010382 [Cyclotella cryptica]|uniref:rRNA adenine N(6)-methyltransferase n=1 Tax=Cyclotella cryptica TaxID=29204 RepID=A0ABD3QHP4_9STRA
MVFVSECKSTQRSDAAATVACIKITIFLTIFSAIPLATCFSRSIITGHSCHDLPLTLRQKTTLQGWVQDNDGEWQWQEDDAPYPSSVATSTITATATPTLPSGSFRPKQSLGQNYLRDGNTVAKIVRAFVKDATETLARRNDGGDSKLEGSTQQTQRPLRAIELGPGAGALTDVLIPTIGITNLQCIEIDGRSVELLSDKHPELTIRHQDVLQVDYPSLAKQPFNNNDAGGPLSIIGNLPYYITSQILFALADASHTDSIRSATVTMQWEVGRRIIAPPSCKDYGILTVVFQLYADCSIHFKIPPTVFYPKPKVDSALLGLHFVGPEKLRRRLVGVRPEDLRNVVTSVFQKRRKTVRNGIRKLAMKVLGDEERVKLFLDSEPLPLPEVVKMDRDDGDAFALGQELPRDWASKRPEELTPGQFIEITRMLYGADEDWETCPLRNKVWRKLNHGSNSN